MSRINVCVNSKPTISVNSEEFSTMVTDKYSVYVQHIYGRNADVNLIARVFHECKLGVVSRVDIQERTWNSTGEKYAIAFIYMDKWYDTVETKKLFNDMCVNKRNFAMITSPILDEKWKVRINKTPRTSDEISEEMEDMNRINEYFASKDTGEWKIMAEFQFNLLEHLCIILCNTLPQIEHNHPLSRCIHLIQWLYHSLVTDYRVPLMRQGVCEYTPSYVEPLEFIPQPKSIHFIYEKDKEVDVKKLMNELGVVARPIQSDDKLIITTADLVGTNFINVAVSNIHLMDDVIVEQLYYYGKMVYGNLQIYAQYGLDDIMMPLKGEENSGNYIEKMYEAIDMNEDSIEYLTAAINKRLEERKFAEKNVEKYAKKKVEKKQNKYGKKVEKKVEKKVV